MKTNDKIIFMALDGAQNVGANCYYLKIGTTNFLLDCGCGRSDGVNFSPQFNALLQTPYLQDFHQISHVFISHAHLDHVAALPDFLKLNERANVYMTDLTWQITRLQIGNRLSAAEQEKIFRVAFLQEIPLPEISVSFHQAGHIPGAMMTLFNFGGRRLLYTGDYSTFSTQLVGAAILPDVDIDVLIICGLHAKHSSYRTNDAAIQKILFHIRRSISFGKKIYFQINQISKGIELATMINKFLPDVEIFIDAQIMKLVHCFEELHIPIINERIRPLEFFADKPCVVFSTEPPPRYKRFEIIRKSFSLHDDFQSVANFVRKINPKICIVVHSPPDRTYNPRTIEQVLMNEPDSRTNFIFPKNFEPFEI